MPARTALARVPAAVMALPLLLAPAACTASASEPPPPSGQPSAADAPSASAQPPGLRRFYDQKLAFGACRPYAGTADEEKAFASKAFQCARLEVPLDYDDPDGETARIALLRVPARGESTGSLLLNPGGPGGPGLSAAVVASVTWAKSPVTERFDLIGFDPRGVGASTPALDCATDRRRDAGDAFPALPSLGDWSEQDSRRLMRQCAERSGGEQVLGHVGTRDAARDMDVLRAVLGEDKLSYFGQSYGTRLGAVYAEMFPRNVRAMVLDGAIDPNMGTAERKLTQVAGFQRAFEQMAADCARRPGCPLGAEPARATATFQSVIRPLIDKPVPAGKDRELTYGLALGGVVSGLYESKKWPQIIKGIAEIEKGRGDTLLALDDAFEGRGADGRWSSYIEANFAINCMDEQRLTPDQQTALQRETVKAAPFMDPGPKAGPPRDGCETWPVKPTLTYPYATGIKGLPETLTISVTGDPSTPYEGGVKLAEALKGSLLTVEGEQHTVALSGASACVNDIVAAYLVDLTTPPANTRCTL